MYVVVMILSFFGTTIIADEAISTGYSKSGCEASLYYVAEEINKEGGNASVVEDVLGNKQLTGKMNSDGVMLDVTAGCAKVSE